MRNWTRTVAVLLLSALPAWAERIKDITEIEGARSNPIWGFGLVVGLNGTGDSSEITKRALANLLGKSSLNLLPADVSSKSVASVMVTAQLPPFAGPDSKIDVTVSAIAGAGSLQGGTLLMTPLTGADAQVYAVAQGSLTIGGFAGSGQAASASKNHPTVGRIPGGATVEKAELANFVKMGRITYQLHNPDFATAERIARAVNKLYPNSSTALDGGRVRVDVPGSITRADLIGFISRIGALEVEVDQPAVVVIDERTGTIVVGEKVTISPVGIAQGSLYVIIKEKEKVSQPMPLSPGGTTEKVQRTTVAITEKGGTLYAMPKMATVGEMARGLNAMGLTPRDLISIFQNLHSAHALQAKLIVR